MPMAGTDRFTAAPGTAEKMRCRVCQTDCTVRRNVNGPASFGEAMAKRSHRHDVFECPHAGAAWHGQALRLVEALEDTPSKRVAQLLQQDLDDLRRDHATASSLGTVPPGGSASPSP